MSKNTFNESQRRQLESLKAVKAVNDKTISYTPEFKISAVKDYQKGKSPTDIFLEHGFDLDTIGRKNPKYCLKRWRTVYSQYGEEGFLNDRRGKASTGRPSKSEQTPEKKLEKAEARIKYLEAELELLKKARRARKAGEEETLTPSEKFSVIDQIIGKYGLRGMVMYLCEAAGVSRSGYYAWLDQEQVRTVKEESDAQDYLLLKKIYDAKKGKAGYRVLRMVLENDYGIIMNHKKIRRLTSKYNLFAKVRRANPYRKLAKATQEHRTVPNHLNRDFQQSEPRKVFLTDITYLHYKNGQTAYLSCVKDVATREIVAFELSKSLSMEIIYRTLYKLSHSTNGIYQPNAMIHSDQGFHYTHPEFRTRVKRMGLIQSMSRKGNCLDNAPMESFFGHLKDEIHYRDAEDFKSLKKLIDQYIREYNTVRYQWNLKKMTPAQYRSHLIAA